MRLLCVLSLVIGVVAGVATVHAACPPNTFTCKDGSCIPEDWVGDGEADCDDRSDETGHPIRNRTAKEDDPFDEIVTLPPHLRHSSKERHSTTDAPEDDCPYEHQLRVDECAEPILLFLRDVNAIYFENSSLLSDKHTQATIGKGCELMHEYQICTQGVSQSCNPDEGVQAWRQVEIYACQLLIPTVREHHQCFGRRRDPKCEVK
ncbi:Low-density lipoprotein receptor domain class A [Trichostrongylus colubriformis]|uniref:Low-density lipoprotein receptor domain class A n=1 Tax=Trichostrongylus colubriformis TaxID=6319 RepID=A0AAN8ICU4_TRICO